MLLDIPVAVLPTREPHDPHDERDEGHQTDEYQPEPDEEEYFLIVEVDRQHALDGVPMNAPQPTNLISVVLKTYIRYSNYELSNDTNKNKAHKDKD